MHDTVAIVRGYQIRYVVHQFPEIQIFCQVFVDTELTQAPLPNMDVHSNGRTVMPPNVVKGSNAYPNQVFIRINLVVILIYICVVIIYIINGNCFMKIHIFLRI